MEVSVTLFSLWDVPDFLNTQAFSLAVRKQEHRCAFCPTWTLACADNSEAWCFWLRFLAQLTKIAGSDQDTLLLCKRMWY